MTRDHETVLAFIDRVSDRGGHPALSDAKIAALGDEESVTVIREDDRIMAIGVTALHVHADGSSHWATETAVDPAMQFAAFERAVIEATVASVPSAADLSVWSSRSTLTAALEELGFHQIRSLAHMEVDLPLTGETDNDFRAFDPADAEQLIRVNNAAFAGHREAGNLTMAEFTELASRTWVDFDGILISEDDGTVTGFCWTRIHAHGDGEIFRIAIEPAHQGEGLGRRLLIAGFAHLASDPRVEKGTLWVDMANRKAVDLYKDVGMRVSRRNNEFARRTVAPGV